MCPRRRPPPQPLAVPGASSIADLEALRARLLLHETAEAAARIFAEDFSIFMGL